MTLLKNQPTKLSDFIHLNAIKLIDIENATGVHSSYLSKYRKGIASPNVNTAIKIAKYLNCSVEDIF